uniref:Uncharacterized protein MANES_03G013700 n=1 Tax=Rhizophora mucronata TaxID=61149 RepID=A0A2P2LQ24_RHIMU
MMRLAKEEPSCMAEQIIDFASSVKELHGLSSQELNKLLRDSENFTIQFHSETRLTIKIDVEKLVGCLPLHLIAMLISSGRDESRLRYLLCGLRLLHSFFDLAPRHTKLEQVAFSKFFLMLFSYASRPLVHHHNIKALILNLIGFGHMQHGYYEKSLK